MPAASFDSDNDPQWDDENDDLTRMAWDIDDEVEDDDDEDEEDGDDTDLLDIDEESLRIFLPEDEIESDAELDREIREANPERPDLGHVLDELERGQMHVSLLYGLSDLSVAERVLLTTRWPSIDPQVRQTVVSEVVDLAQSEFMLDIRRFLLHAATDDNAAVRQVAVNGLGLEAEPDVAEQLLAILRDDPSEDVRSEAATSLGTFAFAAALDEYPAELAESIHSLLFAVAENESESWHVRRRAAESAANFGDSEQIRRLVSTMWNEDDIDLQTSAIFAVGRANLLAWIPTLLDLLEGDDLALRFEAVRALGELGEAEVLPQLSEVALKEEDVDIRQSAIMAIGTIGSPAATRILRRLHERAPESDYEIIEEAIDEASLFDDDASMDDLR